MIINYNLHHGMDTHENSNIHLNTSARTIIWCYTKKMLHLIKIYYIKQKIIYNILFIKYL